MTNHRPRPARLGVFLLLVPAVLVAGCAEERSIEPVATDHVRVPGPWVFEPEIIQVPVGTTVTWTNDGGQPHTVTFTGEAPVHFDVTIDPGETGTFTFDVPGEYPYKCTFHPPEMVGKVIVREGSGGEGNASVTLSAG